MPRRHSLDLTAPSSGASPRQSPTGDHVIAALALLVAAFLGLAGIATGHQQALFAFAGTVVAFPPLTALLLARRSRRRRRRPGAGTRRLQRLGRERPRSRDRIPVLADFQREVSRVLRRGEPDVTVVRLALVPVGGTVDPSTLHRRIVLAVVNWQEVLRPEDRLARVADDRFAVLLRDCPLAAAARVIDRLRDATPPGTVCAVGVATWDRQESAKALLERADIAPRRPRTAGRRRAPRPCPGRRRPGDRLVGARRTGIFDRAAKSLAWLLQVPSITIALVDEPLRARDRRLRQGARGGRPRRDGRRGHPRAPVPRDRPPGRRLRRAPSPHPALFDHHLVVSGTVAACATVPVVSQSGHVVGTVSAMRGERHAWTADELRLLRSTATRIAAELERIPRAVAA